MHALVLAILGGFGWYALCGMVLGLATVFEVLRDTDVFRVQIGRDARVDDLLLLFSFSVLAWPVQVWEWGNHDGPWRG